MFIVYCEDKYKDKFEIWVQFLMFRGVAIIKKYLLASGKKKKDYSSGVLKFEANTKILIINLFQLV